MDYVNSKFMSRDMFLILLTGYISIKERRDIIIQDEVKIKDDGITLGIDLKLYFEVFICGEKVRVYLTDDDVYNIFAIYADNLGYDLDEIKYNGHVRKAGYYTDYNLPIFEGVTLYLKPKDKVRNRKI